MVTEISTATRTEVLGAIRNRYREASKRDKSRMLDEFVALTGCHRKHAVRLLGEHERSTGRSVPRGRRHLRRGCQTGADRSMGGIGQDLWQETEGGTAQHGPVAGETRSSRPRSRRARATILSERQYHGPAAAASEGEGWKPQETEEEAEDGKPGPSPHLYGLERTWDRAI